MSTVSAGRQPVEADDGDVDLTTTVSFDAFYLREMRGLVALVRDEAGIMLAVAFCQTGSRCCSEAPRNVNELRTLMAAFYR